MHHININQTSKQIYLSEIVRFLHMSQNMFNQRMQNIKAVNAISLGYRQVKANQSHCIRLVYTERWI